MDKQTIIEEWETVEPPPPPEVKPVEINPKETALLILDIQNQNCHAERRPRCVERIPQLKKLLSKARENDMLIVYSLTRAAEREDIREEVKPREGEFVIKAGVDKFYQTELEKILQDQNIKTVILVGTSAHGAVLHTATGAAARSLNIIIPVDGMSADTAYAEQYTTWHLAHAPGTKRYATITKIDSIHIR